MIGACYRGMLKWQGFFLSDHTHELKKERNKKESEYLPKQSLEYISGLLKLSWQYQKMIVIQLNQYAAGDLELTQYFGTVKGFQTENIILDCDGQQVKIDINDIISCKIY